MTISFDIPTTLKQQIRSSDSELNLKAREAFLVELFREHEISHRQLGEALGLEAYETDGVLKRYNVGLGVSTEELREDAVSLRSMIQR